MKTSVWKGSQEENVKSMETGRASVLLYHSTGEKDSAIL